VLLNFKAVLRFRRDLMIYGVLVCSAASGVLYFDRKYARNYGFPLPQDAPEMDPIALASMLHAFQLNATSVAHERETEEAALSFVETQNTRIHFSLHGATYVLVTVLTSLEISTHTGALLSTELRNRFVQKYDSPLAEGKLSMKKCRKFSYEMLEATEALPEQVLRGAVQEEEGLLWAYCAHDPSFCEAMDLDRNLDGDKCLETALLASLRPEGPPVEDLPSSQGNSEEGDTLPGGPLTKRWWSPCFGATKTVAAPSLPPGLGDHQVYIEVRPSNCSLEREAARSHFFRTVSTASRLLLSLRHDGEQLQAIELGCAEPLGVAERESMVAEDRLWGRIVVMRHGSALLAFLLSDGGGSLRVQQLSLQLRDTIQEIHVLFHFIRRQAAALGDTKPKPPKP